MTQSTSAMRIPETMGAEAIGPYLRGLREHFALSVQDVSQRLHIRARYVEAIEQGQFDVMPAKVYARGYVHTYAEFLGLDADQVVAQCFVADKVPAQEVVVAPKKSLVIPVQEKIRGHGRMIGIGAVAAGALYFLFGGSSEHPVEAPVNTVAPVPEALLATLRDTVMPTAHNYRCLTDNWLLSCFYSGETMVLINMIQSNEAQPFAPEIELYETMPATQAVTPATEMPEPEEKPVIHEYTTPATGDE